MKGSVAGRGGVVSGELVRREGRGKLYEEPSFSGCPASTEHIRQPGTSANLDLLQPKGPSPFGYHGFCAGEQLWEG